MTTAPTTPLTGRRVVIVGGGSGTGLEVARLAIANGAHVTRAGSGGSGPAGSEQEVPREFGAWSTVHNRFWQWRDAGVFEALAQGESCAAGSADAQAGGVGDMVEPAVVFCRYIRW
ncbi:hypothetical protein ACFY2W_29255 [Streptomyces sp. NPDC001262]|uniref:hypothetical protein n=1 Tax=Streptomyces sp. NPDC001262 TaxID=3364552 RepID=UPI00369743F7